MTLLIGVPYANHLLKVSLQSSHHVSVEIKFWVCPTMCLQRKIVTCYDCVGNKRLVLLCYPYRDEAKSHCSVV